MGKLNIMDLLSFAKAGYSPKDVKELLEMDIPEPSPKLPEVVPQIMEQKDAENAAKEPAQVLPSPDDNAGAEDIDYKKLYEEVYDLLNQMGLSGIDLSFFFIGFSFGNKYSPFIGDKKAKVLRLLEEAKDRGSTLIGSQIR